MNEIELAFQIMALQQQRETLEAQEKALRQQLLALRPEGCKPYWTVLRPQRVQVDQAAAQAYFIKHKDHRCLFTLGLKKADFERINAPQVAQLVPSAPSIRLNPDALIR
jgi:hypothetical protein